MVYPPPRKSQVQIGHRIWRFRPNLKGRGFEAGGFCEFYFADFIKLQL